MQYKYVVKYIQVWIIPSTILVISMDGARGKKYIDIPFRFYEVINHRGIIAKSNYTKKSIKHIVEKNGKLW